MIFGNKDSKAIPIRQLVGMAFLLEKSGGGLRKNVDILTKTDILRTMRSLSRMMEITQSRKSRIRNGDL